MRSNRNQKDPAPVCMHPALGAQFNVRVAVMRALHLQRANLVRSMHPIKGSLCTAPVHRLLR
jgi:hypothetical protein